MTAHDPFDDLFFDTPAAAPPTPDDARSEPSGAPPAVETRTPEEGSPDAGDAASAASDPDPSDVTVAEPGTPSRPPITAAEASTAPPEPKTTKPARRHGSAGPDDAAPELPDFSGEPTLPGEYTLRIVFTRMPGGDEVLVATQSHDLLPQHVQVVPLAQVAALLDPWIARHDALLPDIRTSLAKPNTKAHKVASAQTLAADNSKGAKKAAPTKPTAPSPAPSKATKKVDTTQGQAPKEALPQSSLFPD
jgi:hypothetical protein